MNTNIFGSTDDCRWPEQDDLLQVKLLSEKRLPHKGCLELMTPQGSIQVQLVAATPLQALQVIEDLSTIVVTCLP